MAKSKKLDEIDLRPYQTHFLLQSDIAITLNRLNALLDELKSIIDDPLSEDEEPCEIIEQVSARTIAANELLGWLHYSSEVAVRWATGPGAPKDIENHLVVVVSRSNLLTVVASDKSLGNRLARSSSAREWSKLKRLDSRRLEKALVSGKTRTLWLSGIHRSVAVKPDVRYSSVGTSRPVSMPLVTKPTNTHRRDVRGANASRSSVITKKNFSISSAVNASGSVSFERPDTWVTVCTGHMGDTFSLYGRE
jgi:hypothetical protein